MDVPGPPTYQEVISKPIQFDEAFKPFNVGATRFPAINKVRNACCPGAPLTYFKGGGGPKDFFGSDILAKRDFFGSMKDAGIFLDRENNTGIFFGYCIFHQLKSTIT